jgi:phosphoglycolate phosphatase-like HAD superfamily hydrolase
MIKRLLLFDIDGTLLADTTGHREAFAVSFEKVYGVYGSIDMIQCHGKADQILGLVTGNLESIAYGKLASAAIGQHFQLGGFGSDAAERSVLVKKAVRDASENFGCPDAAGVYLFGDTLRDIQAAISGSAKPIGVATGIYSRKELHDAGAYAVIDSLADYDEVCRLIGG